MKTSELIQRLQEAHQTYGDKEVTMVDVEGDFVEVQTVGLEAVVARPLSTGGCYYTKARPKQREADITTVIVLEA